MFDRRKGQGGPRKVLVLSRACSDLHAEIAAAFADWPWIKVVVDRRRGRGSLAEFPFADSRAGATAGKLDRKSGFLAVQLRRDAS